MMTLNCDFCGKDLLRPEPHGIYCMDLNKHCRYAYVCCKGECDRQLRKPYGNDVIGWEDISDLPSPNVWVCRWMAITNRMVTLGETYEPDAYSKLRDLFAATFQYVHRPLTKWDQERFDTELLLRNVG